MKNTWKVLNDITQRKKKIVCREFLIGDKKIVDNQEICNAFNNLFVNTGPSLAKNIELYPGKDSSSFLGKGIVHSIFLNPITEN